MTVLLAVKVEDAVGSVGVVDYALEVLAPTTASIAETLRQMSGMGLFKNKGIETALLARNESIGTSIASGQTAVARQKISNVLAFVESQSAAGNVAVEGASVLKDIYECLRSSLDH